MVPHNTFANSRLKTLTFKTITQICNVQSRSGNFLGNRNISEVPPAAPGRLANTWKIAS